MLRENPGIDNAAAGNVVAAIGDRAFRDLHPRRAGAKLAAAASESQRNLVTTGARLQILEIKPKKVVPLDDVGIALRDDLHHFLEHRALVHLGAFEQSFESGRVGQRNRNHAIALARRRRELKSR